MTQLVPVALAMSLGVRSRQEGAERGGVGG